MKIGTVNLLSKDEQALLLEILFSQRYALDLVSVEIADIENGSKPTDEIVYKRLIALYDKLVDEI
ncbi:antirepressor AbbA [Cytobacillus suaedae]|nr:antirepressor AbbA [Cytobacillus suaedae]